MHFSGEALGGRLPARVGMLPNDRPEALVVGMWKPAAWEVGEWGCAEGRRGEKVGRTEAVLA